MYKFFFLKRGEPKERERDSKVSINREVDRRKRKKVTKQRKKVDKENDRLLKEDLHDIKKKR